jgi:hypothetical protein
MPAGLEVGVAAGFSGVADAFGIVRFGGVDFGTLCDPPGRGPVGDGFWPAGDCLGPGVPGVVLPPGNPGGTVPGADGFSAVGNCAGVVGGVGLPPVSAGEAPGVPVGFTPIRFGGADRFPAGDAFGEPLGVALTVGTFSPGLAVGFTRFGGVCFWPITGAGEPVGLGDPATCPFLRICGVGNGVGFGRSFGGGFCAAMVFFSFAASAGLTPCHPFSTTGLAKRV